MSILAALARLVIACTSTVLGAMVLWLATLKESHEFWTYKSPYPIWFRNLVEAGFYPLLGLETLIYLATSVILIRDLGRREIQTLPSLLVMIGNWFLLLTTIWIVLRDNL